MSKNRSLNNKGNCYGLLLCGPSWRKLLKVFLKNCVYSINDSDTSGSLDFLSHWQCFFSHPDHNYQNSSNQSKADHIKRVYTRINNENLAITKAVDNFHRFIKVRTNVYIIKLFCQIQHVPSMTSEASMKYEPKYNYISLSLHTCYLSWLRPIQSELATWN